jgi:peptidoglycan/LPS O-acetylase OafA/YrhL
MLRGSEPVSASRYVAIDALRAVACLAVVVFHAGMYWQKSLWLGWPALSDVDVDPWWSLAVSRVAELGFQGVSLFLVLSGFCLYLPLVARSAPGDEQVVLGPFAKARLMRIAPPYWASIAILWAATSFVPWAAQWLIFAPITVRDVAIHAAFLHNLVPSSIWTINGVYWSLALEMQLYFAFPLLVALARRIGAPRVAVIVMAFSAAWPLAIDRLFPSLDGNAWAVVYESMPARLGEFTAGMAAAALVARGTRPWVRAVAWALVPLWVPAAWAVHVAKLVSYPLDKPACALSFAAIAFLVASRERARGAAGPIARVLGPVGVVSYSLYLVHQPIILMARPWVYAAERSHAEVWAMTLLGLVPVLVALAALYHRAFEAPFLAGGWVRKRLFANGRASRPPARDDGIDSSANARGDAAGPPVARPSR